MKFIYILVVSIILSGCNLQDCRWSGGAKYEPKETKTQDSSTDKNKESLPNVKDVVDNLKPEAQYRCRY